MKKIKKLLKKQGFTLVELIIVIAIIAVLAVAAFMMLTKWLGKSRDSRKLADIETTSKSLMVWMNDLDNPQGTVPVPDNEVDVMFDGTHIFTQGVVGEGVVESVPSLQKAPKNPTNGSYYTYSRTTDGRKYQIATELEDGRKARALANNVFAETRVNAIRGNFDPGIYTFLTGSDQIRVMYLPSIVSAGVISGDDIKDSQNFVLDGDGDNLIESNGNKKPYYEAVGAIAPLDVLFEGRETDLTKEATLAEIGNKLGNMVVGSGEVMTEQEIKGLLFVGGTDFSALSQKLSQQPNCLDGYIFSPDSYKCESTPVCESGFAYNTDTDKCEKSSGCASGYTYNSSTNKCETNSTCQSGYTYNSSTKKCEKTETTGLQPTGQCKVSLKIYQYGNSGSTNPGTTITLYHYNAGGTAGSIKSKTTFNSDCRITKLVERRYSKDWRSASVSINPGGSQSSVSMVNINTVKNTTATACPAGYTQSGSTCSKTLSVTPLCTTGGSYNESVNKCQSDPTCTGGSVLNSTTNKCELDSTCSEEGVLNLTSDTCELEGIY